MIGDFRGFELFAIKLFLKVFIYIQLVNLRRYGPVEKLELPNNRKATTFEARRVFRLFELFDRGRCARVGSAKGKRKTHSGQRVPPGVKNPAGIARPVKILATPFFG